MSRPLILSLTAMAMIAFAGNSILCRLALKHTAIDPASFTSLRIASGAVSLWLILRLRQRKNPGTGSWRSALALFIYAAGFSYAYVSLQAATGALLLFGAVQATMIGFGLLAGERLAVQQWVGWVCALTGLIGLLLPGLTAPPLTGSLLMIMAGVAWGIYSLRGRGTGDPTAVSAGNFLRAVPLAVLLCIATFPGASLDKAGIIYAIASGAGASGIGYALWYMAMSGLAATSAATVQLSVPVITAIGGIVFLGEAVSLRLLIASAAILGGIGMVLGTKRGKT